MSVYGEYKGCVYTFVKAVFDKAGARIVVVSFGSRAAALQWRRETSCQYLVLLDVQRQVKQQASMSIVVLRGFIICIDSPEHQSARMSKITNDGLIRSGTGCFIAVPIWQQWVSKG